MSFGSWFKKMGKKIKNFFTGTKEPSKLEPNLSFPSVDEPKPVYQIKPIGQILEEVHNNKELQDKLKDGGGKWINNLK